MSIGESQILYRSAKVLRFLLAPLVLFALAALILAHNSRADLIEGYKRNADAEEYASDPDFPPAPPAKDWDELLDQQGGKQVSFGVRIGGPRPFDRASQEAFVPASITKLFTTGAALEILGPDFRYETLLRWRETAQPGQVTGLTIVGSGDPSWQKRVFARMAAALAKAGVRVVHGPVHFVSADPRWDSMQAPPGWEPSDTLTCDGALPHAFNIELNCTELSIQATGARWKDASVPTPVRSAIVLGEHTSVRLSREGDGYLVEGTWSKRTSPLTIAVPVPDPAPWAERLLAGALRAAKIQIVVEPEVGAPGAARSIALKSPPLRELLKPFLKLSLNLVGQDLWIAIGGAPAVRSYIASHLAAPDAASVRLLDGSGMSHDNRVSPQAVYSLLEVLSRSDSFALIWDSLPIAGIDGTLAERMKDTAAQGVLRAKTGTLSGAYNLAGYVPRFNALGIPVAYVPFVVLTQASRELRPVALAAQNRVGVRLSQVVNQ